MIWEETFNRLAALLSKQVRQSERGLLQLIAEDSQFTRFNQGRVRQSGQVVDGSLRLTLMDDGRTCEHQISFTGKLDTDTDALLSALTAARAELPHLPRDPYQVVPTGSRTSRERFKGQLLSPHSIPEAILGPLGDLDFAGLYAGGLCVRAYADSSGQLHWFEAETFTLDYSLFTADGKAVKGSLAGNEWNPEHYHAQLETLKAFLVRLQQPAKHIPRGRYRTYLAPAAVVDLVSMLSWEGISEAALRRSGGALGALWRGERALSKKFSLKENFAYGTVPRFNCWGEMTPLELSLIQAGRLINTLVSSRTAKEYGIASNYAEAGEYLRSPELAPGSLSEADILKHLDTGLYLSNLHYLNWSDRPQGKITGMTRYACFWVEDGEIVAPIEDLRFDESLYHFFGEGLIDLTSTLTCIPEVDTYNNRGLGGGWAPGMLVEDFTYTL